MIILQWIEGPVSPRYKRWEYADDHYLFAQADSKEKILRWKKVRIILEAENNPTDWIVLWGNH